MKIVGNDIVYDLSHSINSPWKIKDYSAGEKLDDYTLKINLLKEEDTSMTITLEGAAKAIKPSKELPMKWKMRVLNYIKKIKIEGYKITAGKDF